MPYVSEETIQRWQNSWSNLKARAAEKKADAITAAEVVGGAAAMGFVRGKLEKDDGTFNWPFMDVDIQLSVGLAGVMASLAGVVPKPYESHVLAVSSGILASWSAQVAEKCAKTGEFTLVGAGAPAYHSFSHSLP